MTTTEASAPAVELSELEAFRDQVFRVAFQAKAYSGWCDDGFNRFMGKLGFRPVETVFVEAVYGPVPEVQPEEPRPEPTLKEGVVKGCSDTCPICYDNPRGRRALPTRGPLISDSRYEFRYANGDRELVTFADGSLPD